MEKKIFRCVLVLWILILSFIPLRVKEINLPITGDSAYQPAHFSPVSSEYSEYQNRVIRVEVTDVFIYPVIEFNNKVPAYGVGQYKEASMWKNIGLIAHNYSAGNNFFSLRPGMEVKITHSDGLIEYYIVYNVMQFQASDPNDFGKPFINSKGEEISVKDLFMLAYRSDELTFQTCINADGFKTWGVFFVQARLKKN